MKYLTSIFISSCSVLVSASEHFSTVTSMVTSIICDCAHPVPVSSPRKAVPSSTFGDLHARADHYAQFPSRAPSDQAAPAEFEKLQTMKPLPLAFCNRPAAASSTPVTLMHPIFGRFVDECNTHTPTKDDNDFIAILSKCMSGFLRTRGNVEIPSSIFLDSTELSCFLQISYPPRTGRMVMPHKMDTFTVSLRQSPNSFRAAQSPTFKASSIIGHLGNPGERGTVSLSYLASSFFIMVRVACNPYCVSMYNGSYLFQGPLLVLSGWRHLIVLM